MTELLTRADVLAAAKIGKLFDRADDPRLPLAERRAFLERAQHLAGRYQYGDQITYDGRRLTRCILVTR